MFLSPCGTILHLLPPTLLCVLTSQAPHPHPTPHSILTPTLPRVTQHVLIPIVIQNGVDPVSHTQDGTVPEFLPDRRLDEIVCLHVTGRRRLVQDQDSAFPEQGTSQTEELTLTDTIANEKTVRHELKPAIVSAKMFLILKQSYIGLHFLVER